MIVATAVAVALIVLGYFFLTVLSLSVPFLVVLAAILTAYFPTLLAYSLTYMGLDKDTSKFVGFLGAGMLGKMLIGVLAIILVATQFEDLRDPFVVTFIISYFVFTAFEVYGLISKLRANS